MMRHANTLTRGLISLTLAVLFMVAIPVGLITYVSWPLPTSLPSFDGIQLALRRGIDPQLLINTLAVIVWITWIQLAIALTTETLAAVRGRTASRLPVLPGLQPAAAQLVAAITLAATALGPLRAAPAAATLQAPMAAPAYPTVQVDIQPTTLTPEGPELDEAPVSAQPTYRVGRYETLWQLAETTFGDGRRWQEIRNLNIGQIMADGQTITTTTEHIAPHSLLNLPTDTQTSQPIQVSELEVEVDRGDSFWTIAQDTLATAWQRTPTNGETSDYWRQLTAVNQHRLQPPGDPDLIYPNQIFELPPIPADPQAGELEPAGDAADSPAPTQVTVEAGDSLWSIAEAALIAASGQTPADTEVADYWHDVIDNNRDRLAPPHDPGVIYPGQVFQLPAIPAPQQAFVEIDTNTDVPSMAEEPANEHPTEPELVAVTTVPDPPPPSIEAGGGDQLDVIDAPNNAATNSTLQAPQQNTNPDETDNTVDDTPTLDPGEGPDDETLAGELLPIASTLAGLGFLAAGIVALLRRLRTTQIRQRRPGTIPTPPPPDAVGVEATMRAAAAPTATEYLDLALRAMARSLITNHLTPPQLVGVHLTDETLRLLLWTPHHNPPPGWQVDDDGRSWTLPTDVDVDRLRHDSVEVAAPYPALVTAGHQDHAQLLLDLEYLGATQLAGTPEDVLATCHTMALELATSAIADDLEIISIGFGEDLAHLDRIHFAATLAEVMPLIDAKTAAIAKLAAPTPLHGRLAAAGADSWNPIIIFDPTAEAPQNANQLLTAAHAGRSVAAVVGYPTRGHWRLHIENDTIRIDPLGYTFARRNLTAVEQTAITDLTLTAKDLDGMPQDLVIEPEFVIHTVEEEPPPTEPAAPVTPPQAPTPGLEEGTVAHPKVKVLGTVDFTGVTGRFPLRKCAELVTYLTFHRNGVEADTLMEALWPNQPPKYPRLNVHTSRARSTMGHDPAGQPYLPYIDDTVYRISPHVTTDLQDFTDRIHKADQATGNDEINHLHSALELVKGRPFTGIGNGYTWAHTDGIITHTIVTIDNAAHRLAQRALANDDPEQATWAARRGLTATGACEHCYRNLMQAATAQNNPIALEAIYNELLAVIDTDYGPDTTSYLDPETVELYEQQTRKRRRRQAG